ncbi:hypothetical protein [Nonomuraea sp. NPDC049607]|uniref:hypothetical protein n=1 Tax=unclassified Nonomuraea TaxID=2593643 RepID=UPI003441E30A
MRAHRALPAVLALLAAAACGISPTDVQTKGAAPTIKLPPPSKTIFLIRNKELTLEPADVETDTVGSLLGALFAASDRPLGDRTTELRGLEYVGMKDSLDPVQRDEKQLPRTSTLTVYFKGDRPLSRLGKAQIVCTAQQDAAQQDAAFEQVKIVRENDGRPSKAEGRPYTCGELK